MNREQLGRYGSSQTEKTGSGSRRGRIWDGTVTRGLLILVTVGLLTPASAEGETGSAPTTALSTREVAPAPVPQLPQGLIPRHAETKPALAQGRPTQIPSKKLLQAKVRFTSPKVQHKGRAAAKTALPRAQAALHKSVIAEATSASTQLQPRARDHHRVVIQVTQNDPALMNMALNNADNLTKHYQDRGEKVDIEFIAYGPGLHMIRSDTSPVKARLAALKERMSHVTFSGCGNTMAVQAKQENKDIILIPEARVVTTGVARITELQERGWTYVRP